MSEVDRQLVCLLVSLTERKCALDHLKTDLTILCEDLSGTATPACSCSLAKLSYFLLNCYFVVLVTLQNQLINTRCDK